MEQSTVILLGAMLFAQCTTAITPPEAVSKSFTQKFPAATNVSWGKENAKEFEAEFKLNGSAVSANFLADGTWIETETAMPITDLPAKVAAAIKTKYPEWTITEADHLDTPKGMIYETDLKNGLKKMEVQIKEDSTIVGAE